MNTKKPSGLIRQNRVLPKSPEDLKGVKVNPRNKGKKKKGTLHNQKANVKVSNKTKKELDILMTITQHKFNYELVETMLDCYIKQELTQDQQRAFKALTAFISDDD